MDTLFNIEGLYLFTKVVEAGSFAGVSQKLKIPKATLSRKISQLEEELGAQLLVRTTRTLQTTEVGRELIQRAVAIFAAMEDSRQLVSKSQKVPQGNLRVSAGVEFGLCVLSPLVNEFSRKFPKLDIELDLTGRLVDLVYENFDLGVRIGPLTDSTLGSRKLGSFTYGLYASPKFIQEQGQIKTIEQVKKLPKLGFSRANKSEEWRLIRGADLETFKFTPKIVSNNYWVLRNASVAGLGIAFMPSFLACEAIREKRLVQILPGWHSEEIPIHIVYPQQRFLSQKVRTFIDYLKDNLKLPEV